MQIKIAEAKDVNDVISVFKELWGNFTESDVVKFACEVLEKPNERIFLACELGKIIGFAEVSLRSDYVSHATTSPVGYLEAVYVAKAYRKRGYAARLVRACEEWAKSQGCAEFASDCSLTNTDSYVFHIKCGFSEVEKLICFKKELK